jgi:hypothetical protein
MLGTQNTLCIIGVSTKPSVERTQTGRRGFTLTSDDTVSARCCGECRECVTSTTCHSVMLKHICWGIFANVPGDSSASWSPAAVQTTAMRLRDIATRQYRNRCFQTGTSLPKRRPIIVKTWRPSASNISKNVNQATCIRVGYGVELEGVAIPAGGRAAS